MESWRKTSSKRFYYHQFDFFMLTKLLARPIAHQKNYAQPKREAPEYSEPATPGRTSHDVNNNDISRCPIC